MVLSRSFVLTALYLALGAMTATVSAAAHAREIVDATGFKSKIAADHPSRIVTLAPSLGELAADLSGENLDRIVGVSEFTNYPPALKKVRSVGAYARVNLEMIASLKPDLILATTGGNFEDQVSHLRELGLPVVVVRDGTFSQVEESIRLISDAMGEKARGDSMIKQLHTGLDRLDARARQRKTKPTVLLQVGDAPFVVAGGKNLLNEAVARLGAVNIYADSGQAYPRPSLEDAVHRDPERILILSMSEKIGPSERKAFQGWSSFPRMRAVKDHEVKILEGDTILRPTLRLLEGLSLLERAIYGNADHS